VIVAWTPLSPSRRERVLRHAAVALAYGSGLILLAASVESDGLHPVAALSAVVSWLAGLLAGRPRAFRALDVGIDDAGFPVVRGAAGGAGFAEQRMRCVFAAQWLITLRRATMWVLIWPDSLSGNAFRRLWVQVRWNPGRQPADRTADIPPVRHG
jgi:hypothetical protein